MALTFSLPRITWPFFPLLAQGIMNSAERHLRPAAPEAVPYARVLQAMYSRGVPGLSIPSEQVVMPVASARKLPTFIGKVPAAGAFFHLACPAVIPVPERDATS